MNKKMRWVRSKDTVELQVLENGNWISYRNSIHKQPDYPVLNGSHGWATAQKLMKLGYTYEQSNGVNELEE